MDVPLLVDFQIRGGSILKQNRVPLFVRYFGYGRVRFPSLDGPAFGAAPHVVNERRPNQQDDDQQKPRVHEHVFYLGADAPFLLVVSAGYAIFFITSGAWALLYQSSLLNPPKLEREFPLPIALFSRDSPMRKIWIILFATSLVAADKGGRAEYVGGTVAALSQGSGGRIETSQETGMVFHAGKAGLAISWDRINLLEYGQKVDRRYVAAVFVSPMFLLSKKRKHFLTVGYEDEKGNQQAAIFRVDKNNVRSLLVGLEARTGRKVQFQDEEARKAGKG